MELNNKSDSSIDTQNNNNNKNILRTIFLNLLISAFIVISYVYISEIFGSISTSFIGKTEFIIPFGVTLLVFTFFSILAGKFHGFIAGFIGEFLYQLAFYDTICLYWCFIVAMWGFLIGIYKYKPLKYQNRTKILYTFIALIISSFITMILITVFQNIIFHGLMFLVQALLTVIFLVPFLLYLYDRALATKERHIYNVLLTHHPVSQSDHTFYLKFGNTYIYFCSRCSGIILGGLYASFVTHLIGKIFSIALSPEIAVFLCIILPIPGLIDWGTQRMLLRKSTTESRLFTGFVIGSALHIMSFTNKYYLFMLFLVAFYFSILGILMFFGYKKEMRQMEKQSEKEDQATD